MPDLDQNKTDATMWKNVKGELEEFSAKSVFEVLNKADEDVNWHKVVWFSQCNPRMAFILWMAMRERLQTQDRVLKWSQNMDLKCSLCGVCNDTHNHLFFECAFSKEVWTEIKEKMEATGLGDSLDILKNQYAANPCNNTIGSIVKRIGLATTVYYIWKERNSRQFTGVKMDSKSLLKIISDSIKWQLLGLKVKRTANVIKTGEIWEIAMNYKE